MYTYNNICTYTYHLFAKSPGNVGCMQLKTHKKEHVFFQSTGMGVFSASLQQGAKGRHHLLVRGEGLGRLAA